MAGKELRAATNEDTAASIIIPDDEDDSGDLRSLASDQPVSRKEAVVLDLPMYQKNALVDIKFGAQYANVYHGTREEPNVTKPSEEFDGGLLEQTDGDEDSSSLRFVQTALEDVEFSVQYANAFHGTRENESKKSTKKKVVHERPVLHLPRYNRTLVEDVKFANVFQGTRGVPINVSKPSEEFDQGLLEQTDGEEDSSSLCLYQQLYGYATQGKIDSFKDTIERKLEADEVHDPNARVLLLSRLSPHKNTFLHIAASFGQAKLAAEIIHLHKPLLFEKNFEGDTALHIAAKTGDLDTANTLLREAPGAENADEVFMLLTSINDEQNTPLHEALIHGHQSVAKCLIEAYPAFSFYVNKEAKSPLYLAAEEGFDEIVKLINKKAVEKKPEVRVNGKSPLHAAILGRRNNEILKIVSSMEENFMSSKDEMGRTPLHSAASIGYVEGVRFLLGRRISDSHQMDHGGNFPIHSASSNGHVKIVKDLLRHCLDSKELKNSNGENILHVAARCGKDNLVKYFLKKGEFRMLINQKDSNGNTPLHLATMNHHPKVVYRLAWDTRTNLKLLNDSDMTALDITESTLETIASYHGRLTWTVLKSAFAQRAQSLHVLQRKKQRSPQVADSGGGSTDLKLPNEESIKDRVNTLLVVATLVATMAFAAGFTMPGGNNGDAPQEGMAILLTNAMFQAFVICNTIAMYTAILVAVCLIWAQLGDLNLVGTALRLALPLLGISLTMISLAFMAGVYVVVSNLHWLAYVVLILGVLFIFTVLVVFTPLFCKTTSRSRILRWITYFLFCVEVRASGSHNDD
ncbi:PREDICTED: protein ACCELERATED CELL DEATH 6-like [Prunus mume]|uniref:Protein ACCELERATED CELL DEATH 6-like n=1 Tax=Prunus mume TaxID=102107 RepID=A0ABM0PWK3_PRUMU|nr:PREDICTED: protein ACCELERATED CELL DEATH 6-like [Prunus mume]